MQMAIKSRQQKLYGLRKRGASRARARGNRKWPNGSAGSAASSAATATARRLARLRLMLCNDIFFFFVWTLSWKCEGSASSWTELRTKEMLPRDGAISRWNCSSYPMACAACPATRTYIKPFPCRALLHVVLCFLLLSLFRCLSFLYLFSLSHSLFLCFSQPPLVLQFACKTVSNLTPSVMNL